jgi:YfiH family protein
MVLNSKVLSEVPGIEHGFGTKEEPLPSFVSTIWEAHKPHWKQVHGVAIARVDRFQQECGPADALYSRESQIPISVMTADCVPILLAHRSGKAVAAVHAGWRGTRARILRHLWQQLAIEGEKPQDWVAAIGPAIGPCCYEVSEELAQDFQKEFQDLGSSLAVPQKRILDLPWINAEELKKIGIAQVDLLRTCTLCSSEPRFHSYRREGGGTRQWSVIMRG